MNSGRPRLERRNKFLRSVGARRSGSASPIDPTLPRNSDDSAGRFVPPRTRPAVAKIFRRLRSGEPPGASSEREKEREREREGCVTRPPLFAPRIFSRWLVSHSPGYFAS